MQVPALVDALKTYAHTISAFGLRQYRYDEPVNTSSFLLMPSPYLPYSAVIQRTVTDLLLWDRAYWYVTERTWDNFPAAIQTASRIAVPHAIRRHRVRAAFCR